MRKLTLLVILLGLSSSLRVAHSQGLAQLIDQSPVSISEVAPGTYLVDFGQVAFGNLALDLPPFRPAAAGKITVRFGEALKNGRIDTHPLGAVRFAEVTVVPNWQTKLIVAPPPDSRNSRLPAVLTPKSWGVLLPFRWVEVQGWPRPLIASQIQRQAAFSSSWVDNAATFHSSDPMLDQVWNLCHYSIKATSFAGVFVDGDRERLAYEADAYIDQLGYFAGDADPAMPRATFDRLMKYPTWPTEWAPQMVFMAYEDWMETGDKAWLQAHYDGLMTKLLNERVRPDGLVTSSPAQIKHGDIVDWPPPERDGYVFTSTNTVVNAFHLRALIDMSLLAHALGREEEAQMYAGQEKMALASFQEKLFDPVAGLYRDGVGTDHISLHANLFPLAFGLVPADESRHVAQWLGGRGMAASVYAAQFLLEGLFENGESSAALRLITAPGDRSWRHMVDSGATITWEAWDQKYKPNQDWNHAWGAAPANLLPRFVLGAQPLTPGWRTALIQPHPGELTDAHGTMPTPRGDFSIGWTKGSSFKLTLKIPKGMNAMVELPAIEGSSEILSEGEHLSAHRKGAWWIIDKSVSGDVQIEER